MNAVVVALFLHRTAVVLLITALIVEQSMTTAARILNVLAKAGEKPAARRPFGWRRAAGSPRSKTVLMEMMLPSVSRAKLREEMTWASEMVRLVPPNSAVKVSLNTEPTYSALRGISDVELKTQAS
ncbi:MAG: hypothetical protein ACUVSY_19160 [Roseiflexus sp.]